MPVVDTPVHEKVREKEGAVYGCWNKQRPKQGISGYEAPYMVANLSNGPQQLYRNVIYRFSEECRYDMSLKDPKCEGCEWRGSGERYDAQVRANGS